MALGTHVVKTNTHIIRITTINIDSVAIQKESPDKIEEMK